MIRMSSFRNIWRIVAFVAGEARLAPSFNLVAPDYPGFGQSSRPSHNDFAYTACELDLLEHCFIAKCVLIGVK